MNPVKIAIIGCGDIARKSYAPHLARYPETTIAGFFDLDRARAAALAAVHGGVVYDTLAAALNDPGVDLVLNLTIQKAHFEVIRQALHAGKHVYTEKPFTLDLAEARELCALARARRLWLRSAPGNYLGAAQVAALSALRGGRLGKIRLAYAEMNHGRIESWHPNPKPFYDVGAIWDVGIYAITLLCHALGPVRRLHAFGDLLLPERTRADGAGFGFTTPDNHLVRMETAGGAIVRLSCNMYALGSRQGASMEFHGDTGSLQLDSVYEYNSAVRIGTGSNAMEPLPLGEENIEAWEFGRGVRRMAIDLRENPDAFATPDIALHVIDILETIGRSVREGVACDLSTTFTLPS